MAVRRRTCTDCGQQWLQRSARFCGRCGALLPDSPAATADRRPGATSVATRALAVVGLASLLVVLSGLDFSILPELEADPYVDLVDEPPISPNPLSPEEADRLRDQADPDRLQCRPRGCEVWRYEFAEGEVVDGGLVVLDNGLLVLNAGRASMSGDDSEDVLWPLIVAVDPVTGESAWTRHVPTATSRGRLSAVLSKTTRGVLAMSSDTAVSLTPEGDELWVWEREANGSFGELWGHLEYGDVLVLHGWVDGGSGEDAELVGLDAATGQHLWTLNAETLSAHPDALVVIRGGALERLDPSTGEPLWRGPAARGGWMTIIDQWLLLNADHGGSARLVDIETGTNRVEFPGQLASDVVRFDGGFIAVVQPAHEPPAPWERSADLTLVRVDADGSLAWTRELGEHQVWDTCCEVRADGDAVTVTARDHEWEFDTADGGLRTETRIERENPDVWYPRGPWVPEPGIEVEWGFESGRMTIQTPDGAVELRGVEYADLDSFDPLVVSNHTHAIGVRIPEER